MSVELADQALRKGDLETSLKLAEEALASAPKNTTALRIKGMAQARMGRLDHAVQSFRLALQSEPNDFLSLEWLHGALMQLGRFPGAAAAGERALTLRPQELNLLVSTSQAWARCGEQHRTVQRLEAARTMAPNNPNVRRLLGQAYEKIKRNREALSEYQQAIRLNPGLKDAYDRANRILLEEGRFEEAYRLCEKAFGPLPGYGQVRLQAAQALRQLGRTEEADESARRAFEVDPELAEPVAAWFEAYARSEEAASIREKALLARPMQGRVYYGIVKSRKVSEEDRPLISKLKSMLALPNLPPKEKVAVLRALGKASGDLEEYERAMSYFDEAAAQAIQVYQAEHAFDPRRLDAARESFLSFFDRAFFDRNAHLGKSGRSPIFVIGMIRSGTTLVQQILTSHPSIGDAGEQPFWTAEFPAIVDLNRRELRRAAFVEALDRYLQVLERFAPDKPVVSNKWPMNYAHAGLLLLAYPDAKIVHVARNPVDTSLSIWMTDLGEPAPEFSYRKKDIVAVYRDYEKRMSHWSHVLPPGSIFTVRYEDLVADQEDWSRKLVAFCGLEWDDHCLDFYKGERRVHTPSMVQVRKPIYSSSIEKWKRYQKWLGEFAELLSAAN